MIFYEYEYIKELSDSTIEYIDYKLKRIEDNSYKAAEAIGLLGDRIGELSGTQIT